MSEQSEFDFSAKPPPRPHVTDEQRKAAIEKIKKLLRMKRGGTQAEVETALNLARELAAKHGIDLDNINADDEQQKEMPIGHEDAFRGGRVQVECRYAGLICEHFFNVAVFSRQVPNRSYPFYVFALTFVGTDWDREIAIYVYKFLVGHFRRSWNSRRGRCRNRHAFMDGMYTGLFLKLKDRQPKVEPGPGLIRIERAIQRRNQYLAQFGKITERHMGSDSNADQARYRGYLAGQDTEIRSGLRDRNAAGQQLLS